MGDGPGTFEKISDDLGGCGRYQARLAVTIQACQTIAVFSLCTMVFAAASRPWRCADDHGAHFNVSLNGTVKFDNETSSVVPFDSDCVALSSGRCSLIEFDNRWKTIVNEWQLVCERKWVPSTVTTIQMTGVLAGNVLAGQLGDQVGRKSPFYVGILVTMIGNLLAYFSVSWQMLAVSLFLVGAGVGSMLTVSHCLACEFIGSEWRSLYVNIPTWSAQTCLWTMVTWLLQDWRYVSLTTALLGVPLLATWWLVPESVRWYLTQKRLEDAELVLHTIAQTNAREDIFKSHRENWKEMMSEMPEEKTYSVFDLFRQLSVLKITLMFFVTWFTLGCASYAVAFGVKALSGDLFLNFLLFSVVTMPSSALSIFLSNRIGRRRTSMLCFGLAGVCALVVSVMQFKGNVSGELINGFVLAAVLSLGTAWGPVILLTVELYPTVVRTLGYGFQNLVCRIGAIIAPQIVLLNSERNGSLYLTCAILSSCAAVVTWFLKETKGKDLVDNLGKDLVDNLGKDLMDNLKPEVIEAELQPPSTA